MFTLSCQIWWLWMTNRGFVIQIIFLALFIGHSEGHFAAQRWTDSRNCGFINTLDESLVADNCFIQKGVICEVKDYTQCTLAGYSRILGRCFYKTCTSMTWEAGKAYCRSRGWDLTVLGNEEQVTQLIQEMTNIWKDTNCRFYWVGLRRGEWVYPNTNPGTVDRYRHVIMQPCSPWEMALSTCRSSGKGRGMSLILNRADYRFVADYVTLHDINTTWLGLRRQRLDQFMWLDCSPAPGHFAAQRWTDTRNCGLLNTLDESLDADNCFIRKGVICEVKDYTQCTLAEYSRILGRCFYKTCTEMTWEAGKAYCRSRGWDLTVLGNEEQATQLIQEMTNIWKDTKCRFLWVGLRREEWVYPNITDDNVTHVYWGPKQPGLSGDCAIMRKKGDGYEWRAVSCQERHQSLCYYNQRPLTTVAGQRSVNFTVLQSCMTWETASSTCDTFQKGLDLPVITNIEEFKLISQTMEHYGVNIIWLALRKRQLKDFLWLDCEPSPSGFTAQKWSNTTNCAFLNTRDNLLEADVCSSFKGVVCEIKDCRECSVMECTRIARRCFHKTCTSMMWVAARAYCMQHGWDLVVLGRKRNGEELRQDMVSTWKNSSCASFWVGLRREEWIYPKHANLRLTHVFWDNNEPTEAGQCSIMIRTQSSYKWREADCNDKHRAFCVKSRTTYVTSRSLQLSSLPPDSEAISPWSTHYPPTHREVSKREQGITYTANYTVLYAILTVVLWILILLLIAMIIYQRRKYLKKIWKMTQQNLKKTEIVRYTHDHIDDLKLYPEELRRIMEARRREDAGGDSEPLIERNVSILNPAGENTSEHS